MKILLSVVYRTVHNTSVSHRWWNANWNFYVHHPTSINTLLH